MGGMGRKTDWNYIVLGANAVKIFGKLAPVATKNEKSVWMNSKCDTDCLQAIKPSLGNIFRFCLSPLTLHDLSTSYFEQGVSVHESFVPFHPETWLFLARASLDQELSIFPQRKVCRRNFSFVH